MDLVSLVAEVWMQDFLLLLLDFIYALACGCRGIFLECVCLEQQTRRGELCP